MNDRKPNILLISSDHHRGDCLSSLGHSAVMTPQLDQLSFEGVKIHTRLFYMSSLHPGQTNDNDG